MELMKLVQFSELSEEEKDALHDALEGGHVQVNCPWWNDPKRWETKRKALFQPDCFYRIARGAPTKAVLKPVKPSLFKNHCDSSAIGALRFLARNPRPTGGEDPYNAAHLLQIANELESSIKNIP